MLYSDRGCFFMNIAKIMESEDYCLQPVQYYLRSFLPGYNMVSHSHDYFEIMYVEDGEFILDAVLGGQQEQFTVGEGQFVFLDSNVIHRMEVMTKVKIYNFEISLTPMKTSDLQIVRHLRNLLSVMNFVKNLRGISVLSDTANVLMTLKSIHSALDRDKGDDESHYLLQSLMFALFIDIGRCADSLPAQPRPIYITKVLNIIDKNLSKDLSPGGSPAISGSPRAISTACSNRVRGLRSWTTSTKNGSATRWCSCPAQTTRSSTLRSP